MLGLNRNQDNGTAPTEGGVPTPLKPPDLFRKVASGGAQPDVVAEVVAPAVTPKGGVERQLSS